MIEGEVEGWRECAVRCEAENSGTLLPSCTHTQQCLEKFSSFPLSLFLSLTLHRCTVTLSDPYSHIVFCLAVAGTWLLFPRYFYLMSNYYDSSLQNHPPCCSSFCHVNSQDLKQLVFN